MRVLCKVGVLGSGKEEYAELAIPLGRLLAELGVHLLTGAGKGVMTAVSRSFVSTENREGLCIGIAPSVPHDEYGYVLREGFPNEWVELSVLSPLPVFEGIDPKQISRNHIIVLSSDVLVALPGNKGTRNEVGLALQYKKPVILFGQPDEFVEFPIGAAIASSIDELEPFIKKSIAGMAVL
jgi:uncharacterized protein (TIGR00725 family)